MEKIDFHVLLVYAVHDQLLTTNHQLPTTNHQPQRGSPVAWVGKTPLRPLARPQDRSGSPTKGAK
ncbi:MAG: hypothetical protein ACHBN1_36705 [Heteroscytonema crispum UTEX LB 1556]